MTARSFGAPAALAVLLALIGWLLQPDAQPGPDAPGAARQSQLSGSQASMPPASAGGSGGEEPGPGPEQAALPQVSAAPEASRPSVAAAAEDAIELAEPLSSVPHRVLRAWGGAAGARGVRELTLVVEPSLGTPELEQLVREVLAKHDAAEILTVRVFDSEEAVTYDRHTDGGALAERHLVASLSRHRKLGVESLRVRGVDLEP